MKLPDFSQHAGLNSLRQQMNAPYVSVSKWFAFWQAHRNGRPDSYWVVDRDHVRRNLHLLDGCARSAWFDTEDEAYTWAEAQVDDDMQWILRDLS